MEISVRTAQNVDIVYKPAGLLNRIGATFIDSAFLVGALLLFSIVVGSLKINHSILLYPALIILLLYHLICELFFNGRSIGKLTLHLRVVRLDGRKLSFWDCLLRWALRLIDITCSMGIVAVLGIIISSKMQRLGDLAAGTTVIRETPATSLRQLSYLESAENYQPVFLQVTMLTDKDVSIIKEIWREVKQNKEYKLLEPLSQKIKNITGIQTNMDNLEFIQTVIQDYTHLTQNG